MSKGSNSRPLSVPREQFDAAFDSIFKKRTPERLPDSEIIRRQATKLEVDKVLADNLDLYRYQTMKRVAAMHHDSVTDQRTPEERAKDELGPFVPLSSPMQGPVEK